MKRVLIVAGEASADMHAANLVRAIAELSKEEIEFSGLGGDELVSTGKFTPEFYNRDFAVSGLYELLGHIKKIYSALAYFKKMASMEEKYRIVSPDKATKHAPTAAGRSARGLRAAGFKLTK